MPSTSTKKRGNPNWTKKDNSNPKTSLGTDQPVPEIKEEPVQKKHALTGKVVFRASSNETIEGFTFTPFVTVEENEIISRGGKEYNVVDFLKNRSKWYGKKFWMVGDPDMPHFGATKPQDTPTKRDLLKFADEQNIEVDTSWDELTLYQKIFGAEIK